MARVNFAKKLMFQKFLFCIVMAEFLESQGDDCFMRESFEADDLSSEMDISLMGVSDTGEETFEDMQFGKSVVSLPSLLYQDENIFNSFFSIDTWNDLLSEEVKMGLLKLLPNFSPEDDIDEKAKTIEMLFGGENFHFGNPLQKFRQDLLAGEYLVENCKGNQILRKGEKRNYKQKMEEYHYQLLEDLLQSRKRAIEAVSSNPVTTPLSVLKLDRKVVKLGKDMSLKIKKRYLEEIELIKKAVGEDLSSDDEDMLPEKSLKSEVNLLHSSFWTKTEAESGPSAMPGTKGTNSSQTSLLRSKQEDNKNPKVSQKSLSFAASSDGKSGKESVPPQPFDSEICDALTQDTRASFFSLLRDLFNLSEGQLTMPELDAAVGAWQVRRKMILPCILCQVQRNLL